MTTWIYVQTERSGAPVNITLNNDDRTFRASFRRQCSLEQQRALRKSSCCNGPQLRQLVFEMKLLDGNLFSREITSSFNTDFLIKACRSPDWATTEGQAIPKFVIEVVTFKVFGTLRSSPLIPIALAQTLSQISTIEVARSSTFVRCVLRCRSNRQFAFSTAIHSFWYWWGEVFGVVIKEKRASQPYWGVTHCEYWFGFIANCHTHVQLNVYDLSGMIATCNGFQLN